MTSPPRFGILGPLQVRDPAGRVVPLGGWRVRELLTVMLLDPNVPLSRDRLVDLLWGEAAGASAGVTLRTHVAAVRRVLTSAGLGDRLQTVPGGYVLVLAPSELDVHEFERLARDGQEALAEGSPARAADLLGAALALWRGAPLGDLGSASDAEPAVARLMEMQLVTEEAAIDAALELGRHREVVARLQQLVTEHPFREGLCGQLMLALYRSSRQVDALAVYAEIRGRLREELGLDPSPLLRDLHAAILGQAPALLAPGGRTAHDPGLVLVG